MSRKHSWKSIRPERRAELRAFINDLQTPVPRLYGPKRVRSRKRQASDPPWLSDVCQFLNQTKIPALNSQRQLVGCFSEERLIGLLSFVLDGDNVMIEAVAIAAAHRRQGLATEAFSYVLDAATAHGLTRSYSEIEVMANVHRDNADSHCFCRAQGLVLDETRTSTDYVRYAAVLPVAGA